MNRAEFHDTARRRAEHVQALVACCSRAHVRRLTQINDPEAVVIRTVTNAPVSASRRRYGISVREFWSYDPERVLLTGLQYVLTDGRTEREVIAFHRHDGRFPEGHYHLGSGLGALPSPLDKVHIPAAGVALEAFIAMLITEFGIRPRRADWETFLAPRAT